MQRDHYIISFILFLPFLALAQYGHGTVFDNYGGIYNVVQNPANSVESKYRYHINGMSYHFFNPTDIGETDFQDINQNPNGFNALKFSENEGNASNENNSAVNQDIMLPSVLWGFSPRHAAAFLWRSRSYTDYQGYNGGLWARLSNADYNGSISINTSNFNNTTHQWDEFGINYAFAAIRGNYHFLKIGGTIKYLAGRRGTEVRGSITTDENGNVTSVEKLTYLNTSNEFPPSNSNMDTEGFYTYSFGFDYNGQGIGGDIGLVYEWRPRETNRVGARNSSATVNTYKLRLSAAVLDIGSVKYSKEDRNSEQDNNIEKREITYTGNPLSTSDLPTLFNELNGNNDLDMPIQQGSVTFALPRSLHINADYLVLNDNKYYVNFNYVQALTSKEDEFTNSRFGMATLAPRFETPDFSVSIPFAYVMETSSIHVGLAVRYKYITAGCAALANIATGKPLNHVYFGISLPVLEEVF
ncbi:MULTISPECIES: DUF5723 family protein [Maribacter]|uniref:DUF5723 family protein n=1 Tax=Maribacter flavus TaxID=1658664 RepID=A0ABU7IEP7_9FLAO|nr:MULTISPECIES: DUF5723 family protein [Maribacter]MDC6404052.1 DUF5723 family protein [Maribacter sp. PR66]MEE1971193.1 DUF5723 family protein [Maribacter flavus]